MSWRARRSRSCLPGWGRAALPSWPGRTSWAAAATSCAAATPEKLTLKANEHYWAGPPAIPTIELIADIGGRSPVEAFEAGELDYTPVGIYDASWIAFDKKLGPQLLDVPSLSLEYYGFDVRQPPFDDIRVRQAFGMAIDWRRIAALRSTSGGDDVATSMVPPGHPRPERPRLPPQATTLMPPERSSPKPAIRAVPGFRM